MDDKNKIEKDKKSSQINDENFELDDMMDESFVINYDASAEPYDPDLFDNDDVNCDDF